MKLASDDRISRLSAATLRISQSLDLATVLQEVVDSACELTGAGSAVITTIDERGSVQDLVTSGFSPEDRAKMLEWSDGPRLFEHLRDLPEPISVADLDSYLCSLGLSPLPWGAKSMQGMPMHYRGEHLGSFFLSDKGTAEAFTAEDEEILVLFASQAATAIRNARTHREVERARTDMEVLIETSPVGVVVFDAGTGHMLSLNLETRRIVEEIRTPGRSVEQLLEVMTWRDADGREGSLAELPLAKQLEDARTMRAEEIELSVPDGRSIRTLLNVTPIRSEHGNVERVVVTMQDLAALEALEKQRAEFLGMVSHELRAPLTSIKGSTATVLAAAPIPAQPEMLQFFRIIDGQADHMRGLIANLLDAGSIEAGTLTVAPTACDVAELVDRSRNTFLSGGGRHTVLIDLPRDLPWAMADGERIVQVLNNLLSNAARHSPPSSPIRVEAACEDDYVALSVSDQGRGIPPDRLPHLFRKGADSSGGSGLGLVICKGLVEAHGGRIRAESGGPGLGARFTFTIPLAASAPVASAVPPGWPAPAERGEKTRILVVDDDPRTLRYVRDALSAARYAPIVTGDPDDLSSLIRAEKPHLVLLDLMLPGTDGIELMQQVPELSDLPVIFISGYGRDETIVRALGTGAADYIVKPFSPTELVARIQVALRGRAEPETFVLGQLTVDSGKRRVTLAGRRVPLTTTEYDLLRVLTRNAGRVVTTRTLLRRVWGKKMSRRNDRVRTAVKQLRAKLGDNASDPTYIFTAHGVGYRFAAPEEP
ncbi:MAG: ATP-binding protein [Gemmatimonadetes bacterium]|nr:ATP-binding protein [Gemmatimonadota bacterium]